MPAKSRPIVGMATPREDEPLVLPAPLAYTVEERGELRAIFSSPVFRKALANARLRKPTVFTAGLNSALGQQIGNNQLHRLQGWMLCESALMNETLTPQDRRRVIEASYPDEGRIDYQSKNPKP